MPPLLSLVLEFIDMFLLVFQRLHIHPDPHINIDVHESLIWTPPFLEQDFAFLPWNLPGAIFHPWDSFSFPCLHVSLTVKFKNHVYHVPFLTNTIHPSQVFLISELIQ